MQVGDPLASDGPITEVTARIRIMRAVIAQATSTSYRDEHRQLGDIHRDPPRLGRMYAGRGSPKLGQLKLLINTLADLPSRTRYARIGAA